MESLGSPEWVVATSRRWLTTWLCQVSTPLCLRLTVPGVGWRRGWRRGQKQNGTAQPRWAGAVPPRGAKPSTFESESPPQTPELTALILRVVEHVKPKDSGVWRPAGALRGALCRVPGRAQLSLSHGRQTDDLFSLPNGRSSPGETLSRGWALVTGCLGVGLGLGMKSSGKREQFVLGPAGKGPDGRVPSTGKRLESNSSVFSEMSIPHSHHPAFRVSALPSMIFPKY